MGQKRRRIALSCVNCRRRKVKCDRTYPACDRCKKNDHADQCSYVSYAGAGDGNVIGDEHDGTELDTCQAQGRTTWRDEAVGCEESAGRNSQGTATAADHRLALAKRPLHQERPLPAHESDLGSMQNMLREPRSYTLAAKSEPLSIDPNPGVFNPIAPEGPTKHSLRVDSCKMDDQEKVLLRGKSFKTQYYGPSSTGVILLQLEDLAKFVKEILTQLPSLMDHKQSLVAIRQEEKAASKARYDTSLDSLLKLVPVREACDCTITIYLELVETSYRILHVPTFLETYEAFWKEPGQAEPGFVVILLLAMAIVYCVTSEDTPKYMGRSSEKRNFATNVVNHCRCWCEVQSQKHVSLGNYQAFMMLWLAKRANCIKQKGEWHDIGSLVRRFMSAGMHREPSLLSQKISAFDCEMRRRLWYTALELDLQATLDRGMTPTIGPNDWDTLPPRNIDDEQFDINTTELPPSKPRTKFTRTAFLAWAAESLPLRVELLYRINNIHQSIDFETVMAYDDKVRTLFDNLPANDWRASCSIRQTISTSGPHGALGKIDVHITTLPIMLSKLVLLEVLLILHQPLSTELSPQARHWFRRSARRNACQAVLYLYNSSKVGIPWTGIDPASGDTPLSGVQRRWFACSRADSLRAALSIAHDYAVSAEVKSSLLHFHIEDHSKSISLIAAAVDTLEDRVKILGQGFHSYWILSSALSFVHSKQNPQVPRSTFARAAADRVVKLQGIIMENQLEKAIKVILNASSERNIGSPRKVSDLARTCDEIGQVKDNITTYEATKALDVGAQQDQNSLSNADSTMNGDPSSLATPVYQIDALDTSGPGADLSCLDRTSTIRTSFSIQDMVFEDENMDWNTLMNTDPMTFMMEGWEFA